MKNQPKKGRLRRLVDQALQSEPVRALARKLYHHTGAAEGDALGYAFGVLLQRYPEIERVVVARIEAENPGKKVSELFVVNREGG